MDSTLFWSLEAISSRAEFPRGFSVKEGTTQPEDSCSEQKGNRLIF